MCTQKDYDAIANAISMAPEAEASGDWDRALDFVAYAIAEHFAQYNKRFDEARFLKACDPQS